VNVYLMVGVFAILGVAAGVIGGMFGIGGGLVIVPALIMAFGFDQRMALGTSLLAQLLPVALLAVIEYSRRGEVNFTAGTGVAVGLFLGTWLGARFVGMVPKEPMKQAYGVFLLIVGVYFLVAPSGPAAKVSARPPAPAASPEP
jgi:hypothetical protein